MQELVPGLQQKSVAANGVLSFDVIVRDFKKDHPDFEMDTNKVAGFNGGAATLGLVKDKLGDDGKPVFNKGITVKSAETFNQWFNHVEGVNKEVAITLNLTKSSHGTLVADKHGYFPIDDLGWADSIHGHNFWFTLELHHGFIYHGGERFTFRGDDDLWVFINRTLAIDLGGMHIPLEKSVKLDDLGLTKDTPASLDIFFAERHTMDSNFRIETTIKLDEDPCITHPFIHLRTVSHSNLGDQGPHSGDKGLVYRGSAHTPGEDTQEIELHVNVKPGTEYSPVDNGHNGFHGQIGSLCVKPGTEATFIFKVLDAHTKEPKKLDIFHLTFFDLDLSGSAGEYVELGGFSNRVLMSNSAIKETAGSDGKTRFSAGTAGTKFDNPHDTSLLTIEQKNRAVTLEFRDFTEVEVTMGTEPGGTDSDFLFEAKPSLHCAVTEGATGEGDKPEVVTTPTVTLKPLGSSGEDQKKNECCVVNWEKFSLKLLCFEKQWWMVWCG